MNDDEVMALLRQQIKEAGGTASWIRKTNCDINPGTVSQALTGAIKHPPISVLNALGLKKVVHYEPK